jgi:hypothetical protein
MSTTRSQMIANAYPAADSASPSAPSRRLCPEAAKTEHFQHRSNCKQNKAADLAQVPLDLVQQSRHAHVDPHLDLGDLEGTKIALMRRFDFRLASHQTSMRSLSRKIMSPSITASSPARPLQQTQSTRQRQRQIRGTERCQTSNEFS